MKNSLKKILLLIAVIITAVVCLTFSASAATEGYYTYDVENGKATITNVDKSISGNVVIPSTLGGYPVKIIDYGAFADCKNPTSVTIPDSVTIIGIYAFEYCSSLKSVTIGNSVTSIGNSAFSFCSSLTSITIPDSVTSIGNYVFEDTSLASITIPESVTSIGRGVFIECHELTDICYLGTEQQWIDAGGGDYSWLKVHYNGCKADYTLTLTKASTCTAKGSKKYTCPCGQSYTKKVKALGHDYSSSYTVDKKATCTAKGSKSKHCTRSGCTAKTSVKSISALGHSYGAYKTTKKATLTANGTKVKTCSRCSGKSTATIYYPKTFKLSATSYIYNGKAKKPAVTVKDSKGNTLKNGTDYKVTYSANTAIGTAKATVSFMGNYSGSKVLTFKIALGATDKLKVKHTATTATLKWNKVTGAKGYKVYVYNKKGELQLAKTTTKTSLTVDDLSKGTYYKFTVKAYTKIKKETVWAETTKSVSVTTNPGTPTLKATAGKGKAELSWSKVKGANGYVLYMASSKKGEYSKVGTFEGVANLKATKSKLKSGKTYYFKVRAYKTVDGKNIYSSWSSVKSVKIK